MYVDLTNLKRCIFPREKNSRHLDCGNLFLLLEEEVMNSFNYKKKCVSLSIIDSIRNEMSG